MSKKPPYIISESAMSDHIQIKTYSDSQWGKARTKEYLKNIHDKCLKICLFPKIGIDIAGIGQGIKSVAVENHVVFYKIMTIKSILLGSCTKIWTLRMTNYFVALLTK